MTLFKLGPTLKIEYGIIRVSPIELTVYNRGFYDGYDGVPHPFDISKARSFNLLKVDSMWYVSSDINDCADWTVGYNRLRQAILTNIGTLLI